MLTIHGQKTGRFCDGVSRRDFLRIGGLALGGLSLPQILRAEAGSGVGRSHKAVIMIFLPGGPSHQDIFDLKMDAPSEIRGEFRPIGTNVPGIQITEHLPLLAGMMDKCTLIRSMSDCDGRHDAFQCLTGRPFQQQPPSGWPSFGSVVSKLEGALDPAVPAFVGLAPKMGHMEWARCGEPGFLGVAHAPFQPNKGGAVEDMTLNGVTLDRLADRRTLLDGFDQFRRDVDASGLMGGLDTFNQQAFGVLTSSKLLNALDVSKEDPRILERYGKGDAKNRDDGGPKMMEHFLAARRLVEAGARCVTVAFSRWDHHGGNFSALRQDLPLLDQGLTALLTDLHERGLDKDVSVVVWGEFGRTPTINKDAGRDHWPRVSCALLAGGGMQHGQVIGATDRLGGEATERPVRFGEVFATLYQRLGIDVAKTTVQDLSGRPQYLVEPGCMPMKELI
ncbi:MAG TPA: DUF1501 domain-containing protein [Chthoniobacter sp.]|nr:DUF1501 domain-containing protein [Chthoniobacter sp.]